MVCSCQRSLFTPANDQWSVFLNHSSPGNCTTFNTPRCWTEMPTTLQRWWLLHQSSSLKSNSSTSMSPPLMANLNASFSWRRYLWPSALELESIMCVKGLKFVYRCLSSALMFETFGYTSPWVKFLFAPLLPKIPWAQDSNSWPYNRLTIYIHFTGNSLVLSLANIAYTTVQLTVAVYGSFIFWL